QPYQIARARLRTIENRAKAELEQIAKTDRVRIARLAGEPLPRGAGRTEDGAVGPECDQRLLHAADVLGTRVKGKHDVLGELVFEQPLLDQLHRQPHQPHRMALGVAIVARNIEDACKGAMWIEDGRSTATQEDVTVEVVFGPENL